MAIQEEYGCVGFYGFGAGVEIERLGPDHPIIAQGTYCSRLATGCPLSQECWDAHRKRVNDLLPAFAEFIQQLQSKGLHGEELAKMVVQELGTEPYSSVLLGNLEDGGFVERGEYPKDRGEMTLPYPFKEKN